MFKKLAILLGLQKDLSGQVNIAVCEGNLEKLKQLASHHGNAAIRLDKDPNQVTTLHFAAEIGNITVIEFLLSIQADPSAGRINNFTPLHAAAMVGNTEVCKILIDSGANINAQTDPQKYAPIHSASNGGYVETVKFLIEKGANIRLKNYREEYPIDTAKRTGEISVVELLTAKMAELD